jgi:ParB-like chromosome segregation protein Spo0J
MELTNMTRPKIAEHNAQTNEVIVREMNDAELAQYQIDQAAAVAYQEALATKATARQAILERLGLTQEEVQLILGGSN